MARTGNCHNIADFERLARKRLPAPLYHYIAGGADDERTMLANIEGFDRYNLAPDYLKDIRSVDMGRRVLGRDLAWPLLLAPTGMTRMFHRDGELGVAREAERSGVGYALSTMATSSIEDVGRSSAGPKIFQLYLLNDEQLNFAMIDRCKAAGFDALCLTVDTIVAGNRERDLRTGLTVPPRLTAASILSFALRPRWCVNYLTSPAFSLPNVGPANAESGDLSTLATYFAARMERNITWAAVERVAQYWGGPFAIKGIQSVRDARMAAAAGATAVILSNHGGRQLDGVPPTIDLLADIVDAVGDRLEVILDGGIRRGSHIVKALAMGATACMAGRPYLYGLSAFGAPGVGRVLELLRAETERTLALLGCGSLSELGRNHIRLASEVPDFLRTQESARSATPLRNIL
ncbi:alpha-hydroxy-acid oxidizing protein [Sphingobium sp. PNB]|uniref:alpha-hydroxy acid oxidase n=1 Tax=Sphingobium sp. PNB TaxID=863934 RepID=UPI001CA41C83|nr:alpha-hydroxy acid oxidase [Sphingobium sp. PNB]MCB4860977.1 alpha-hydroxy-acid oxidizing protein [Sphingobium sp. PNB]